jgi:hypothetical protein
MRINQGNVSQCPIVEEEPNVDTASFLICWKILTNYYRMVARIIVNYRS